jgi:predicted phage terminase large subunit-like protein
MTKTEVIQKCADSLTYLGKTISPQTYYLPSPSFHSELDLYLTDRSSIQTLIEAPRGTAKSSKAVMAVFDHVIFDIGDKFVLIQSKTRPEAINRLTKIKDVLNYSQPFRELFGYSGENVAETWREDKIKVKIGRWWVTIKALGTGQPVRGALESDTRITLYLLDDPDDELNTITKEQMDKNFDYFLGGLAGLDRRNGRVIVIGTPIREGCIVERLRNATNWVTKRYQAYDEDTKECLWNEMYPYEWLMNKKKELEELGKLSKFYSEYLCQIVGDEDRLMKKEYLRWYDGHLTELDGFLYMKITHEGETEYTIEELITPKIIPVNTFLGVDPASSTKQTADFSVSMPIAYTGKDIYMLDYFRKRVTPTVHAEQIINSIRYHKFTRVHVETVGYQEMLRDYLRKRLREENLFVMGMETKITPRTEKSSRLERLHPYLYNRVLWIKKSHTEFVDEMVMYPRGKHDDTLDGLDLATKRLIAPSHSVAVKTTPLFKQEIMMDYEDIRYARANNNSWMLN